MYTYVNMQMYIHVHIHSTHTSRAYWYHELETPYVTIISLFHGVVFPWLIMDSFYLSI